MNKAKRRRKGCLLVGFFGRKSVAALRGVARKRQLCFLISSPPFYRLRDTTGYHSCPACQGEKHQTPSSLGCVTPPVKLSTHRNSNLIVCFGLMAFFCFSPPVSRCASRRLRSPTQSSPVTVHDVLQRADGCSSQPPRPPHTHPRQPPSWLFHLEPSKPCFAPC